MHDHTAAARTAIQAFNNCIDKDADDVYNEMVRLGMKEETALEMGLFMPLAFFRALMADSGIKFTEKYLDRYSDGSEQERVLADNEYYASCYNVAAEILKEDAITRDQALNIVGRSSELDAVNKALQEGSKMENIKTLLFVVCR